MDVTKDGQQNPLITEQTVNDYFHQSFQAAVQHQEKSFAVETTFYIVNLLSTYAESSKLFISAGTDKELKPLAFIYADAVNSASRRERIAGFKYLGDLSLFISGLYAYSLNRSLVDVDYYIAMGENAYYTLVDTGETDNSAFGLIYHELSTHFLDVVEVLNEVADQMQTHAGDDNILRAYEQWMKTGNQYCARKLRQSGIEPNASLNGNYH